ncbi:short-chain dehydrogenase/reductase SDR [Salinisphaera sp. PC39]|uniref:SDR family NAD(P)-dependent oxidoreductase n=1 Tax=Salinisphaera sp. PC39 TaxID=1304156 RepID=UPI00333E7B2C
MRQLDGRVAAITGAGSGIGRATALALADAGCALALSDVDEAGLAETVRLAEGRAAAGRRITQHTVDVADKARMAEWADAAAAEHDGVNIVINNAGVALSQTVEDMAIEDVEWLFGINWWGVVYGTRFFLPHLRKADEGHIVNLSSLFGLIGVPTQSAYCAAKFAVRGFTETLRIELADSPIGVTCVHPGGIATEIARRARFSQGIGGKGRDEAVETFDKIARTSPEKAAADIVAGIRKGKGRVVIGADAKFLQLLPRLMPMRYVGLVDRILKMA